MLLNWNAVSAMDRIFDDVMGAAVGAATSPHAFEPAIDVRANQAEVVFVCDVPGVKRDDLEITLAKEVLTIKGARKFERSDEGEQVLLGRAYGSFHRAFALPENLDDANLKAELKDGVLTIRIPKTPKAQPRKIPIGHEPASSQLTE